MPNLLILCSFLLAAQEVPDLTRSRTVITSIGHNYAELPKISRGQILTLFVRGLSVDSSNPGSDLVPVRTYAPASYEVNGVRARLTVPALPGESWDIPILGIALGSAGNTMADARGVTVQVPLQIPDRVLTAGNVPVLRRPKITLYDHGVEGLATEFEWYEAIPNIVRTCDIIVRSTPCAPWIFRLDGSVLASDFDPLHLGEEVVVVASGLAVVLDPTLRDGQVFSDPPPAMKYPVFVAFGSPGAIPPSPPEVNAKAWLPVDARPAPGQIGLFELRLKMPATIPFEDGASLPLGCTPTLLYVNQGPAGQAPSQSTPVRLCLKPRPQ